MLVYFVHVNRPEFVIAAQTERRFESSGVYLSSLMTVTWRIVRAGQVMLSS